MTLMDKVFVAFAFLDLLFIAGMAVAGFRLYKTAQKGGEKAAPAIREVMALKETGMAMAKHARTDGLAVAQRVKSVAAVVKRRVATTRRIVGEIRPHSEEASAAVKETSADLSRKAHTIGDMAQRLSRVKAAASAATRAAREG